MFFIEQLESLQSLCKQGHTLTLYALKTEPDNVWARLHNAGDGSDRRYRLSLKSAEQMPDMQELPYANWVYPCRVSLASTRFKEEIDACDKSKACAVSFTIQQDQLVFTTATDHTSHGSRCFESLVTPGQLTTLTGADQTEQRFSVVFLVQFGKCVFL